MILQLIRSDSTATGPRADRRSSTTDGLVTGATVEPGGVKMTKSVK